MFFGISFRWYNRTIPTEVDSDLGNSYGFVSVWTWSGESWCIWMMSVSVFHSSSFLICERVCVFVFACVLLECWPEAKRCVSLIKPPNFWKPRCEWAFSITVATPEYSRGFSLPPLLGFHHGIQEIAHPIPQHTHMRAHRHTNTHTHTDTDCHFLSISIKTPLYENQETVCPILRRKKERELFKVQLNNSAWHRAHESTLSSNQVLLDYFYSISTPQRLQTLSSNFTSSNSTCVLAFVYCKFPLQMSMLSVMCVCSESRQNALQLWNSVFPPKHGYQERWQ